MNDDVVELKYCNSQEQIADLMSKPFKLEQFEKTTWYACIKSKLNTYVFSLREGMLTIVLLFMFFEFIVLTNLL